MVDLTDDMLTAVENREVISKPEYIHVIAFCTKDRWYIVAGATRKGKRKNEKNNTYDNVFINISFTC